MNGQRFDNVWDAIEDDPSLAANLKLRSSLMMILEEHIRSENWTQAEAAKRFGVTQPRISDLVRGKIDLFGIDTLVTMLSAVGLTLEIQVKRAA